MKVTPLGKKKKNYNNFGHYVCQDCQIELLMRQTCSHGLNILFVHEHFAHICKMFQLVVPASAGGVVSSTDNLM